MGFLAQLAMQAGQQALGSGMGLLLEKHADKRQLKQQEKLQELEIEGSNRIAQRNFDLQKKFWEETNYKAQMEQLKMAGLNPSLLYGMGGTGGATTGNQGGSVTGSEAPKGGNEIATMTGMGINLGLMQAQKELLQSQAKLNNVEADKKQGIDTKEAETRIESLTQGIENAKALKELTEIETNIKMIEEDIKGATQNAQKAMIMQELRSSYERMNILMNEGLISKETVNEKIKIIQRDALAAYLRNNLIRAETNKVNSDIKVNDATITKWINERIQKWEEIRIASANSDTQREDQLNREWINDVAESTALPASAIEKVLQALALKEILKGKQPEPVKGFRK